MNTPMLKRRLNPFLLASTVLILSLLAGLSVLFQGQLNDVVSRNNDLDQQITEQKQRISTLEAENNNLTQRLSNRQQSLSQLQNLYNSLKQERDALASDVSSLETQLNNLESQVESIQTDLEEVNQSLEDVCSLEYENMTGAAQLQCEEHGHAG